MARRRAGNMEVAVDVPDLEVPALPPPPPPPAPPPEEAQALVPARRSLTEAEKAAKARLRTQPLKTGPARGNVNTTTGLDAEKPDPWKERGVATGGGLIPPPPPQPTVLEPTAEAGLQGL